MTIVIGLIAQDGIVVAADREEGDGYLKNDAGKTLQVFRGRPPIGWIAVTGAGDAAALDEISGLLGSTFCEGGERTSDEAQAALTERHRSYYSEIILPCALQPINERPDYSLVIGCFQGGFGKALFVTSKLVLNAVDDYAAVGIGTSIANAWLGRLYDRMPAITAIKLAAFVIYQVKNAVNGCGLGTDIVMLRGKGLLERVNPALIRKWEEAFRYYPSLERNVFSYCIGVEGTGSVLLRTRPDTASINKGIENFRKALTLEEEGFKQSMSNEETEP